MNKDVENWHRAHRLLLDKEVSLLNKVDDWKRGQLSQEELDAAQEDVVTHRLLAEATFMKAFGRDS